MQDQLTRPPTTTRPEQLSSPGFFDCRGEWQSLDRSIEEAPC